MRTHRIYLGDGVYACIEDGMVKLTTEDGITTTNTIYLEPDILAAFMTWVSRLSAVDEP